MRSLVALAAAATLTLGSIPARAQNADPFARMAASDDVLYLKDGTTLRGRIIRRVEDESVTIRTLDGVEITVAWDRIGDKPYESIGGNDGLGKPLLIIAGAGIVVGGGMMLVSLPLSDAGTRRGLQTAGGVALGAGLTTGFVVIVLAFSGKLRVFR